jgi:hypothetical protein
MSTTATQARMAIRNRIEAAPITDRNSAVVPFRWQNETADSLGNANLPSDPSPFVYCEFITERGRLTAFGGGVGKNLYRNPARLDVYVLVPKNDGLDQAESIAEQVASLFRSYRDSDISCFDATVYPGGDGSSIKPAGLNSPVGSYFYATAEVSLYFDQIG